MWRAVWAGAKSWLSPELDPIAVESVAFNYQELCRLRDGIASGEIPEWAENEAGRPFAHPALARIAALESLVMAWSAQLGLNPSDRSRLGLSQVRVTDADDEITRRIAEREAERQAQVAAARDAAGNA